MTQTETTTIKHFPLTLTFSSRLCQKILLPVKEIGRNVYIASMSKVTAWEVHNMNSQLQISDNMGAMVTWITATDHMGANMNMKDRYSISLWFQIWTFLLRWN